MLSLLFQNGGHFCTTEESANILNREAKVVNRSTKEKSWCIQGKAGMTLRESGAENILRERPGGDNYDQSRHLVPFI